MARYKDLYRYAVCMEAGISITLVHARDPTIARRILGLENNDFWTQLK